jgi:hypothetical protein
VTYATSGALYRRAASLGAPRASGAPPRAARRAPSLLPRRGGAARRARQRAQSSCALAS